MNSKTKEATWKVPDAVKKMQADSGKDESEFDLFSCVDNQVDAPVLVSVISIRKLISSKDPSSISKLRLKLKKLRALLMKLPEVDGEDDEQFEENLIRSADLLAMYEHTKKFFRSNEPWLDRLYVSQYAQTDDIDDEVDGGDLETDESVANAVTEKTSVCAVLLGWLDRPCLSHTA